MTDDCAMQEGVADVSVRIKGASVSNKPGGLRKFILSTLKIGLAITFAGLILGGILAAILGGIYWHEESKNRLLAVPKFYRMLTVPSFEDTKFTLLTKFNGSLVYYQFDIEGFPSSLKKYYEKSSADRNNSANFTIILTDDIGFRISDILIPIHSMIRVIGEDNSCKGLSFQGSEYLSAGEYRQISSWQIQWTL